MVQGMAASLIIVTRWTKVVTQSQSVVCEYIPINAPHQPLLCIFTDLRPTVVHQLLTFLEQQLFYVIINNCSSCFITNHNHIWL